MLARWRESSRSDRAMLVVCITFFSALVFAGGASRADELAQFLIGAVSAVILAIAASGLPLASWRKAGAVTGFLVAAFLVIAMQLIPLPPAVWSALPGRAVFAEAIEGAGMDLRWHSLTLTPDMTIFALLSLVPAFAILALSLRLSRQWQDALPWILLLVMAAGVFLGVIQAATGSPYFYRIANFDVPTGSFANRNHFALFTAMSVPLLAVWASAPGRNGQGRPARFVIAAVGALIAAALLLLAGSRGGLLVAVVGYGAAFLIFTARTGTMGKGKMIAFGGGAMLAALALAAVFVGQSRDVTIGRIFASGEADLRKDIYPALWPMMSDFFPFGSGFGSFVPVYKVYEPLATLGSRYINHAHNDVVQIVIEGGLPALVLLVVFSAWFVRQTATVWRGFLVAARPVSRRGTGDRADPKIHLARAASTLILMIGIMSLFDYPMRTPLITVTFVLAIIWLQAGSNLQNRRNPP